MLDTVKGILKKAIFLICIFNSISPCAKKNRLARVVMVLTASVSVCMYVCRVVCLGWWRWCLELVALYGWMVLQGDVGGYNASEGWTENIYERNLRSEMSRVI